MADSDTTSFSCSMEHAGYRIQYLIRPWPDDAPHPFKGKTVADMKPTGSWWHKGWVIYFTDGTWFSTHPMGDQK